MSVIALLLSAVVGYILYFLFVLETTPQWITGNRSFVPESGGLEMISYWAMRGEDYMVKPKDYSVLCIHGAWNSALVWDLGEHEKYFEEVSVHLPYCIIIIITFFIFIFWAFTHHHHCYLSPLPLFLTGKQQLFGKVCD